MLNSLSRIFPGAAGHPFARAGGFGGGQIDPEDFVNMFFGQGMRAPGGFRFQTNFGGGMHQRQRRAHHPRAGRHHHQQAPQEDPNLGGNGGGGGFLYLFLIVMSAQMLFNSGGGTESYSLKRTQEFSQPVGMHSRYLDYVEMTYYMRPGVCVCLCLCVTRCLCVCTCVPHCALVANSIVYCIALV